MCPAYLAVLIPYPPNYVGERDRHLLMVIFEDFEDSVEEDATICPVSTCVQIISSRCRLADYGLFKRSAFGGQIMDAFENSDDSPE